MSKTDRAATSNLADPDDARRENNRSCYKEGGEDNTESPTCEPGINHKMEKWQACSLPFH